MPKAKLFAQGRKTCLYEEPFPIPSPDGTKRYLLKYATVDQIEDDRQFSKEFHRIDPDNRYFCPISTPFEISPDVLETCPVYDASHKYKGAFILRCGTTVSDYLEQHPDRRTPEFLMKILGQLLRILSLLQREKIYHWDIANRNILIDENENIHLIDFFTADLIRPRIDAKLKVAKEYQWNHEEKPPWLVLYKLYAKIKKPLDMAIDDYQTLTEFYQYDVFANIKRERDDSKRTLLRYWDQVDLFSVAVFINIMHDRWEIEWEQNSQANIVNSMLTVNPETQYTIQEALDEIQRMGF